MRGPENTAPQGVTEQKAPRKDLGWANDWPPEPAEYTACKAAGHRLSSRNLDLSQHGLNTLYFCDVCAIEFHVDSSD